ncbi:zinc-binding alcohol dehydrogenase [Oenococcus sicerae]|uniref:Zinc-binding alcohol dehydrogenase n=1 Tax=Oenococcus sicerae TaxID=2203724 RepID=A0AAJ1R8V3_9LACO|nr:zinc-binding alcohol dehydrogenase [Oenococcus sicerae]MDN6900314.1 zinc-binding alcohol dehydrogenase [Oenococcus sicerae]QAS69890.1 zinc-binding alcohol dehydrogenase [Oenococcus sicerae]
MLRKSIYWPKAKDVEYHEEDTGQPKDNDILIENHYSLVSQSSEREWLENDRSHVVLGTTFPFIPGYSSVGYVKAIGASVSGFEVGDKVIGAPVYGAHSNLTYVKQQDVYHVPENVHLDDAVFYNLGMTAIYTLQNSGLKLGHSIALIGQGVVGQIATQVAKASGFHPIVTFDLEENRRQRALENGADYALDPSDAAAIEDLIKKLAGGVDAAIDMSGSNAGMNLAIHLTKTLGTTVFCTGNNDPQLLNYGEIFIKCLTVKGDFVNTQMALQRKCINTFLWLLSTGTIQVPDHENTIYEPTEANIKKIYGRVLAKDRTLNNPIFKWN